MPKRRLHSIVHLKRVGVSFRKRVPWKRYFRNRNVRQSMRDIMMEKLAREVRDREVNELLYKQQFGVTKPKRGKKV